ncbi:type II toxin-antitoxin system RelE/ParE family toxin [Aquimarina agarilytica]|uniref:type II toxin-antitoxin system RelE/ParE family toxin n=1 Tax=Aquimarina agarilytica TaxID=1087449 RepID=UPI0002895352|nr:type II toxin-antitoxin system RelE/ParE family toxin [Aquimarina agarilytica]
MQKFILSTKADNDIEDVYNDGVKKIGKSQAIKYLEELNLMFVFFLKTLRLEKIEARLKWN